MGSLVAGGKFETIWRIGPICHVIPPLLCTIIFWFGTKSWMPSPYVCLFQIRAENSSPDSIVMKLVVESKSPAILNILLEHGLDTNWQDSLGNTGLHLAAIG